LHGAPCIDLTRPTHRGKSIADHTKVLSGELYVKEKTCNFQLRSRPC
jgi:hypothetical protein